MVLSGSPLEAFPDCALPPRTPWSPLTHCLRCSLAARTTSRTRLVSSAPRVQPPDSACGFVPQVDACSPPASANNHINALPAGLIKPWCASRSLHQRALHVHSIQLPPRHPSRSATHLHCKGFERRALHVSTLLVVRACFAALSADPALLPRDGCEAERHRDRPRSCCPPSLAQAPSAQAVCSSRPRNLKPPAHAARSRRVRVSFEPLDQAVRSSRSLKHSTLGLAPHRVALPCLIGSRAPLSLLCRSPGSRSCRAPVVLPSLVALWLRSRLCMSLRLLYM